MDHPKTYFILPTTIYKPDDYIQLGQVITDPRRPFERLAKPLPLEGPLEPRIAPAIEWSATNTKTGEASVGVFAYVVNLMTAEASGGKSRNEAQTWEAALLETRFFEISEDPTYVEQTAKIAVVEEWLKKHRHLGKTVYMITGLKIAKNPGKVTYDGSDASNLAVNLKAALNPEGVVEGRCEASHQRSGATTYEEKPEGAYVFAYRLRKLRVTWKHKFKLHDYKKGGDLHGVSRGGAGVSFSEEDEDDVSAFEMESVLLEQNDFGASLPAKDKKFQAVDEDDDSACLVIRATAEDLAG
ncbi:hypothetical protein CDV36_001783 [Fusarium kuroshium]|uniref:Uncharacterized protein n=2 Tax=Fusarium solani species complex TaxID=232080 RepID=A0A3M2SLR2_9HYPO|nr:hypothetical protein CDV36_001783 [Fusarium kuroshium]RSL95726.1 hypothetical protein CEP52_011906 [Fusarium oligoseptatum]